MGLREKSRRVMIIAGEASGDLHGAALVRAMGRRDHTLSFFGIGGRALRDAGCEILVESSTLSVVGITEALGKLPVLARGLRIARQALRTRSPDLLVLIDFPDFNLLTAAAAKKLGIPVLYYISPQVWAWRRGRVKKIRRLVDRMAVIFPFEEAFYRSFGVPATFVGHPLMDRPVPPAEAILGRSRQGVPVIGLLPGSRDREILRHLPVMLDAAGILNRRMPELRFVVSVAPSVEPGLVEAILASRPDGDSFRLCAEGVEAVFRESVLVIAASGTVTLESAIWGTPMVIMYKVSPVSFLLGRMLVRINHVGLVNLVAGREIIPEILQDQATPEGIAHRASRMLADPDGLEGLRKELLAVRERLGRPGACERVADMAMAMLNR